MGKVSYSAVVLDDTSHQYLVKRFENQIPKGWEIIAHHMTINMGELKPEFEKYLGMRVTLKTKKIGFDNLVMAVEVEGFPTVNKIPHITLAVNRAEGGKPYLSNKITDWRILPDSITLTGIVEEVGYN